MNKLLLIPYFTLFLIDRVFCVFNPFVNAFKFAYWINDLDEQKKSFVRLSLVAIVSSVYLLIR